MSGEVLHLSQLKKTFGIKTVLEDVSFHLNRGDRAALVGENGAGKTTLAKLIIGQEKPDSGLIRLAPGAEIGYLPQDVTSDLHLTIRDYVEAATGQLKHLRDELTHLEDQFALNPPDLEALLARYGDLQEEFQRKGGYELDYRLEQVMQGLEIAYLDSSRVLGSLSGGEKTRVALAALLLRSPDLLILDEPTNHLDVRALEWLENYLVGYENALLMISHDRHFINQIINQIIELSPLTHTVTLYHGDYDSYRAEQQRLYQDQVSAFEDQREEIKRLKRLMRQKAFSQAAPKPPRDNDKFIKHFKQENLERGISKDIRDAKVRLERLEDDPLKHPGREWRIGFDFQPLPLTSQQAIRLVNLSKGFDGHLLFSGVNAVVNKGERIVISAPNGAGKTTLLKLIMGLLTPDSGEVVIAPSAKVGYLDQEQALLDLHQGVLDAYREETGGKDQDIIAALHRGGLFSTELLDNRQVGALSVGMQRKLAFAKLVASHANVLLLDEPTNHLDLTALEALEAALLAFEGAILAVSHDRWFTEKIATRLWRFSAEGHLLEEQMMALSG